MEAVTTATSYSSLIAKKHAWEAGNLCLSSSSGLKRQNHIFPFPGGYTVTLGPFSFSPFGVTVQRRFMWPEVEEGNKARDGT